MRVSGQKEKTMMMLSHRQNDKCSLKTGQFIIHHIAPTKKEIILKKQKKQKVVFDLNELLNDADKKMQLAGFIDEYGIAIEQVKGKQLDIKNIRDEAKESLGLPPKVLLKLVKEHQERGFLDAEIKGLEDIKTLSDAVK